MELRCDELTSIPYFVVALLNFLFLRRVPVNARFGPTRFP